MVDLRLDIPEGAFAERKNGRPVVPGKPEESLLIKRVFSDDPGFRMPPVFSHKTLTADQKEVLRHWIEQGAKWSQHWAFVPPKKVAPPAVNLATWPRNDMDRFILAKLEAAHLSPAPEADRNTLIRRVTLDLTGLPPAPAEVDAFIRDTSPNAYEKVVDRLLASPHYGEQRARYWLDAARYADTNGYHFDNYREIWPYRDWVINAFNGDMPFDRFTIDQLAGDLLPKPTLDQKVASGFQRCNETTDEGGSILAEVEAMYAKDRADTTGTVWLGLTVGCATCHDHKFDPISQKDYYSLTAFFRNTVQTPMDLNVADTPPAIHVPLAADRARWEQLTQRHRELASEFNAQRNEAIADISQWLDSIRTNAASYTPPGQIAALNPQAARVSGPVEIAEVDAIGAEAYQFRKQAKASFPPLAAIDTEKPFTMATWIYMPSSKDDSTIASQMELLPESTEKNKKRRGWVFRIDRGNLGLYDHAPAIYFFGADGKGISARPAPQQVFQPDSWFHLVVTYDGSGYTRGIQMYLNGAPLTVLGRPEDIEHLTTSFAARVPITLGNDEKQWFESGRLADFRVLNTLVTPGEAELLYHTSRINAAGRKQADQLSESDKQALATYYTSVANPATASLISEIQSTDAELQRMLRRSPTTLIMQERKDSEPVAHVLYRGQYDQMRDEVHANTPSVLPPMLQNMPRNRLGLAMWIVDPGNPLTARVTVNRFWQELFGTGIVRTVEDFGSQGEPASHPELLDWLAVDFRDSGWDVKRLFKMMVMSAAYRQSAATTPEKISVDPQNRLLARGPRFRMDAEMVRDCALSASGLLRPDIGGPSAKPYQPAHIWDAVAMPDSNTRIYEQDTASNLYRRSMYTFWKRAAPPPSMDIFNAPSRETCTVRRERTDTPLQALVTMNDVQFMEAARVLAQNALQAEANVVGVLDYMSERVLARALAASELDVLTHSYDDFLAYYGASPDDAAKIIRVGAYPTDPKLPPAKLAAMTMVANEMLNLDEALVK
jgi:cytochrome c553